MAAARALAPGSLINTLGTVGLAGIMGRDVDPTSAPVALVLQFLTNIFDNDEAYRTINVYSSVISASHVRFEVVPTG